MIWYSSIVRHALPVLWQICYDRQNLIFLSSTGAPKIFKIFIKHRISMSSIWNSIINNKPNYCVLGIISSINSELSANIFSTFSKILSAISADSLNWFRIVQPSVCQFISTCNILSMTCRRFTETLMYLERG